MSYINDSLMPGEKIIFTARINPAVAVPVVIVILLMCSLFVLFGYQITSSDPLVQPFIGLMYLLPAILMLLLVLKVVIQTLSILFTTEFGVTNRRVIAKTGFINRHSLELFLEKIESVSVRQDILGRLFNFGVVTVTGTGGTKESFKGIVSPLDTRKKINQVIETYTRQVRN